MTTVKLVKVWRKLPVDPELRARLSQALGISPVTAQILLNRGVQEIAAAQKFLHGGAELIGKVLQEAIDAGSGGAYFPVIAKHIDRG